MQSTGCRHFFDATVVAAVVTDLDASGRRTGAPTCRTSSPAPARGSTCARCWLAIPTNPAGTHSRGLRPAIECGIPPARRIRYASLVSYRRVE